MRLQKIIEKHWYQKLNPLLSIPLFIFSLVYKVIVHIRCSLFWLNIKRSTRLGVPVVIVGNISVGGAGKTPLTKYLASKLQSEGIKVGIVLRGYKSLIKDAYIVNKHDDSEKVGDEALIYANAGFLVAIGANRVNAAKLLLEKFPDIKLIIADDGLQHYYLARDFEICVVDSTRGFGNQNLLPMGPLRESIARIKKVDALVINGSDNQEKLAQLMTAYKVPAYMQTIELIDIFNPVTGKSLTVSESKDIKFMAVAGIGNPMRFFLYLTNIGVSLAGTQSYPDHYHYEAKDIDREYEIITTEKDYTKLAKFKLINVWIARVNAKIDNPELLDRIKKLVVSD